MSIITKLVSGKRDPSRVNIFLDHKFAFSLSLEEVVSNKLKQAQVLSKNDESFLRSLSQEEKVYGKILNYLSYRPRSVREVELRLKQYLKDHDNPTPLIQAIIEKLESKDYLNDQSFASWFVASRQDSRPRSLRHLASELSAKGISSSIVKQALVSYDEKKALHYLINKKKSLPHDKLKAYLLRRGFSYQLIRAEFDSLGIHQ